MRTSDVTSPCCIYLCGNRGAKDGDDGSSSNNNGSSDGVLRTASGRPMNRKERRAHKAALWRAEGQARQEHEDCRAAELFSGP